MVLVRRHGGGKMRWFSKVNMRKPIAKTGSSCLFNFLLSIKLMIVDMTRHSTPRRPGVFNGKSEDHYMQSFIVTYVAYQY